MRRVRWLTIPSFALAGAAGACFLVDPPPAAIVPQKIAPSILTLSVSPRVDQKLTRPPDPLNMIQFVVPVRVDPDKAVVWRVFMDLDPSLATPPILQSLNVTDDDAGVSATDADVAVRVITFPIDTADPTFASCHKFTFIVAYGFDPDFSAKPDSYGGDMAFWNYEPVNDCSFDDAAPPTFVVEAGADADGASD